jgi:hypothetical protein
MTVEKSYFVLIDDTESHWMAVQLQIRRVSKNLFEKQGQFIAVP